MENARQSGGLTGDGAGLRNTLIVLILVLLGIFAFAALRLARDLVRTGAAELERRSKVVAPPPSRSILVPKPPSRATTQPFAYAVVGLRPRGSPGSWVSNDDYPAAAIRAEQQGTVGFTLSVDAEGRPSDCVVTRTSGVALLDETACSLMMRRARFEPARDAEGKAIAARWSSRFRWELPD